MAPFGILAGTGGPQHGPLPVFFLDLVGLIRYPRAILLYLSAPVNRFPRDKLVAAGDTRMLLSAIMKRLWGILGLLAFMVGVLLIPAVHAAHLDHAAEHDEHDAHQPDTCAVCFVSATATIVPCTTVAVASLHRPHNTVRIPAVTALTTTVLRDHPARAPPRV